MNQTLVCVVLGLALAIASPAETRAQSLVDFREAVRSTEPSLMSVIVSPADVNGGPQRQADAADVDQTPGPRIELFDLEGQRLDGFRNRPRGAVAVEPMREITSAAFAVDENTLIAYVGGPAETVLVRNARGEEIEGQIIALDFVTGLAAIKVQGTQFPGLVISAAQPEPGMPVVAAWIDDKDVLRTDAGMVSTRPIASGSGVGATPSIDFGSNAQGVGAAVIDASGIVVGVLVPSLNGELVCAGSTNLLRLVDRATGADPKDLRRGLLGIQFEGGGPLVMEVSKDSGADLAGIKAGDVVAKVGQTVVRDASDVIAAVEDARAGDTLEITVRRGEETLTVPAELMEHPRQSIAQPRSPGNRFGMQRGWEFKDGQMVPMEIDPNLDRFPQRPGQFPFDEMLEQLQIPFGPQRQLENPPMRGREDGFQIEPGKVEETLKELQRQMEQLNRKFDEQH
jgi:S1-C subfamily serine protease